ncbi:MAG: zinc ribbon domain-containing protein [Acidobacteriota bacterium]|nr:zinc ribbon domain-containing protein [Acidobacteriota bacterium]
MPLYEYECTKCGERTEIIQRLADSPLSACPKCDGAVKKLISAPSFQFKGSGWYVTDYAGKESGSSTGPAEKDSKATSSTSTGSEAKNGDSGKKGDE